MQKDWIFIDMQQENVALGKDSEENMFYAGQSVVKLKNEVCLTSGNGKESHIIPFLALDMMKCM